MATDRKRGFETAGDMIRSLALVGAVVALMIFLTLRQHDDPVTAIDYGDSLRAARSAATYPVLAPTSLPAGWRATSARTSPDGPGVHWHLGLLTSGKEQYVGIEQSDGGDPRFVREQTAAGVEQGTAQAAGRSWTVLRSDAKDQVSLVDTSGGVVSVVTGTLPLAELQRFAETLRGG